MAIFLATLVGLFLSIHGGSIGRGLWRFDCRTGTAWQSERDYVLSLRLFGAAIVLVGLIGS